MFKIYSDRKQTRLDRRSGSKRCKNKSEKGAQGTFLGDREGHGLPQWLSRESACTREIRAQHPDWGRSPLLGEGMATHLHSCQGNSMDREPGKTVSTGRLQELDMTENLAHIQICSF